MARKGRPPKHGEPMIRRTIFVPVSLDALMERDAERARVKYATIARQALAKAYGMAEEPSRPALPRRRARAR